MSLREKKIFSVGEQFLQVTHCDHIDFFFEAAHGENTNFEF